MTIRSRTWGRSLFIYELIDLIKKHSTPDDKRDPVGSLAMNPDGEEISSEVIVTGTTLSLTAVRKLAKSHGFQTFSGSSGTEEDITVYF